jgi:hypothetical protein
VAAKSALYRVVALEEELIRASQISSDQQQTVDTLQAAVNRHEKSMLDLAAAQRVGKTRARRSWRWSRSLIVNVCS